MKTFRVLAKGISIVFESSNMRQLLLRRREGELISIIFSAIAPVASTKNRFLVILVFFWGCGNSQDNYLVAQIYRQNETMAVLRADRDDGTRKYLNIYKDRRQISGDIKLKKAPCEISEIHGDSVFIDYYIFRKDTGAIPSSVNTVKGSSETTLILVEQYKPTLISSISRTIRSDSIELSKEFLLCFHSKGKYSFNLNRVLYNGDTFFVTQFEGTERSFINVEMKDKEKLKAIYLEFSKRAFIGKEL